MDVGGTPPPEPAPPRAGPVYTLDEIATAAAAATRRTAEDIGRRGATRWIYAKLAKHQGWIDAAQIAATCGTTPHAIRAIWRAERPGLEAGALCLGDRRLLQGALPSASPKRSAHR